MPLDPATGQPSGQAKRLTENSADDHHPVVLPGNEYFLFISDRQNGNHIWVADIDGEETRLINDSQDWGGHTLHASPDGRWISATGGPIQESQLHLIEFDADRQQARGPSRPIGTGLAYGFSRDSNYLSVHQFPSIEHGIKAYGNLDSAEPELVHWPLSREFLDRHPNQMFSRFSPDGRWVAFGAYEERHKPAIFVVELGGDTPKLVWDGSGFPMWMPDGRIYIWPEGDARGNRLGYVPFDPETGRAGEWVPINLAPVPGSAQVFDYSMTSDGRWLLFGYTAEEGDLFVADVQ